MSSHVWLDHVANGEAYAAEDFIIASGSLFSNLQLFNPVDSNVRVRVRSFHLQAGAAVGGTVRRLDAPLLTLGPPAPFILENLLGGGKPPMAEVRHEHTVAVTGSLFWSINAPAAFPATYPPGGREWGADLLPGQGILIQSGAGTTPIANWQWVEVPL